MTRLERWERAERDGLNPPREVRDIVLAHPNDDTFEQWFALCTELRLASHAQHLTPTPTPSSQVSGTSSCRCE